MTPLSTADLQQILDDFAASGRGQGGAVSVPPVSSLPTKPLSQLGQALAAPTNNDLTDLEDALFHISADVPRGNGAILGPKGAPLPDYWFGVVLACRREYGDAAKEVVRRWSQTSSRYGDGSGFEHAWNQFDPKHPNPVTVASLFTLAKANGWARNVIPAQVVASSPRFKLLDRAAIMTQPPLRWRIKGLLPETGIGAIYGASGSGKSFLAIDMAFHIASGTSWFGHRVSASPVTYVMLESEAGLRNRVQAWEAHNRAKIPCHFSAIAQPFVVAEPDQVEALGAELPEGGVVIIDTLNCAAPGLDENSSQDMGRILAGMKRLQQITAGLVLVVHHTGKDASKGLRGHSSLHAALDGAVEVERRQSGRCWSAAKVKDGEDGKQVPFKLHAVNLGMDADGDPIISCAVGPDSAAIFAPKEPAGKRQRPAYRAIKVELGQSQSKGKAGTSPTTSCLPMDRAIQVVADGLTTEALNKRRNRAKLLVQDLLSGGYLYAGTDEKGEAWVWA